MLFKTLEIQGFKSFADKTVLEFDRRTTAIVGSNGNGKSNISDALLWVMGEQGAKNLRGKEMTDVIFLGTEGSAGRKPAGVARVALTIDNSDRTLSVDSDEVVISRKLYRDGESEYLINGKRSRLRDIQEMLMGTGLGRDGYSIIGQGRVEEIIKAKDTQRRELFEEAAGVSRFLHQKANTEKELKQAEENIIRQRDLIRSDEERLPRLKAQSEKAVLAADLIKQKETLEISVSVAQLNGRLAELDRLSDELLRNQGECDNFKRDIERYEEKLEELDGQRLSSQARQESIRRDIKSANEELNEKNTAISVAENELKNNQKRREEIDEQLKNAEQSGRDYIKKIDQIKAGIEEKKAFAEQLGKQTDELRLELDRVSRESERAGEQYSALEREIAAAMLEKGTRETARSMARSNLENIWRQREEFLSGISEGSARLDEYKAQLAAARKKGLELAEKRDFLNNKSEGMERLAEGKKKRFEEARTALEQANSQLNEKNQRYRVLSDIEKSKEGYNRSAKEVLRAGEQGRITGIHGIIADVITVPEKYVMAIEIALGGAMQHIIVDTDETAARCMQYLKEIKAGYNTFYPISATRGRNFNEPGVSSESGFEGIASDLVKCDPEYAKVISSLLGNTVIVDDINSALFIGKKYGRRFKIVTLDGQVSNAGGSYTGGYRDNKNSGIISRKQELDSLYAEIVRLRDTAKAKNEEFERYRAENAKFAIELEGLEDEINALEKEDISNKAEISRLSGLIDQLENQGESSRQTLLSFDGQIAEQNNIIADADKIISELTEKIDGLNRSYEAQNGERSQTADKIAQISDKITELNDQRSEVLHAADLLRVEMKNIETNRHSLIESSDNYKQTMEKLDSSDREIRENIERIKAEVSSHSGDVSDKEKRITELAEEIVGFEKQMTELRRDINTANQDMQKYTGELARLEERKANVQNEYDKIVALLLNNYELTVSEAQAHAEIPDDLLAAENDLAELTKRITALGNINMESIEEYQIVSERYEFQSKQLRDIENAKSEMEKLIAQLNEKIKTQFMESFNAINGYFKEVVTQIFGPGSHAELELTNPDDVLNTGVEIKAAPPGKVIKYLGLLSGGEKTLVVISIYFAILMHRPTPFCMLDEADAALDAVNVEKYIKYLNQFSKRTQLMIISHRRGTIEGCSVLYGVVMQEKGVSRLLRQELSDETEGIE